MVAELFTWDRLESLHAFLASCNGNSSMSECSHSTEQAEENTCILFPGTQVYMKLKSNKNEKNKKLKTIPINKVDIQ